MKDELKTCRNPTCGRKFVDKVGNRKFCSDFCRVEYWKYYGVKLQCPNCGKAYRIFEFKRIEGGYVNEKEIKKKT